MIKKTSSLIKDEEKNMGNITGLINSLVISNTNASDIGEVTEDVFVTETITSEITEITSLFIITGRQMLKCF